LSAISQSNNKKETKTQKLFKLDNQSISQKRLFNSTKTLNTSVGEKIQLLMVEIVSQSNCF